MLNKITKKCSEIIDLFGKINELIINTKIKRLYKKTNKIIKKIDELEKTREI